jgi:gluconate:H+ symporter, GntP family
MVHKGSVLFYVMHIPLWQSIVSLLAGIAVIIWLTVQYKLHPFFALLIACFVTGLSVQLSVEEILKLVKIGFGDILSKLSLIIVLGTAIGVLLEKNGHTKVMADFILKITGIKRSAFALSITGFITGLPIFCDSGYIVLNGINKSLIRQTGYKAAQMSVSLAAGLYSVHCLLPPHPGASAAAGTIGVDFGKLIGYGILIAFPAMLAGHWWAVYAGKKSNNTNELNIAEEEIQHLNKSLTDQDSKHEVYKAPTALIAFLPVLVPLLLMSVKSFIGLQNKDNGLLTTVFNTTGDPAIALAIGLLITIITGSSQKKNLSVHLSAAVEKAGSILVIIGAGAAFGAVLLATDIGNQFSNTVNLQSVGIWFPFLLTVLIKTAQGSSTVAIITASSIVLPLLSVLGLNSENGKLLAVLSMGAGSMMISHTNDAYFWVVSKFSNIDIRTMLRVHSVATIWMGLTAMLTIYLLSIFVL